MKKIVPFILIIFALSSCSKNKVFEKYHNIKDHSWNRFEKIKFKVLITDVKSKYDIYIAIRHITQYPYSNLLVGLFTTSPSGEQRVLDTDLKLRDEDGKFLAQGLGDIWDIEIPVKTQTTLSDQGIYLFEIENLMSKIETPGIMQIGLIVKKSKE